MRRAVLAAWEFVVGDDWVAAAGIVVAVALTAALQSAGVTAWWLMPAAVLGLLARSLAQARPPPE